MSGHYDAAQICLNGHVINDNFHDYPDHNACNCPKCGEPTTIACASCKAEIRGSYEADGVALFGAQYQLPAFCHNCGRPYPWTDRKLKAATELADELDELNPEEKEKLKRSLNDLVRESANSEVASLRFKKVMKKVGKESYEGMKSILTSIASEALKKTIFGP